VKKDYAKRLREQIDRGYNDIAKEFSRTRDTFWDELRFTAEYAHSGERVLDVGCGNGRFFEEIQDKNITYTGIDSSEELINIARKKHDGQNVQFLHGDALNLPFENNQFNAVFSFAVLHHIPSGEMRAQFMSELQRVLAPNSVAVITVWNLWHKKL